MIIVCLLRCCCSLTVSRILLHSDWRFVWNTCSEYIMMRSIPMIILPLNPKVLILFKSHSSLIFPLSQCRIRLIILMLNVNFRFALCWLIYSKQWVSGEGHLLTKVTRLVAFDLLIKFLCALRSASFRVIKGALAILACWMHLWVVHVYLSSAVVFQSYSLSINLLSKFIVADEITGFLTTD